MIYHGILMLELTPFCPFLEKFLETPPPFDRIYGIHKLVERLIFGSSSRASPSKRPMRWGWGCYVFLILRILIPVGCSLGFLIQTYSDRLDAFGLHLLLVFGIF
jgi:hypothetical protein